MRHPVRDGPAEDELGHPAIRLTLHELEQHETYAMLFRGELDLAITFDYAHAPEPVPAGISREHLLDDPIMVVLPAGHRHAAADRVDPAGLPPDAWIKTEVEVAGIGSGHRLDFEGQDFRTALNLVAAGLGVALLPWLLVRDAPPTVVVRPLLRPRVVRRLYTCRLDTRGVAASIRRLETYLREAAAAR